MNSFARGLGILPGGRTCAPRPVLIIRPRRRKKNTLLSYRNERIAAGASDARVLHAGSAVGSPADVAFASFTRSILGRDVCYVDFPLNRKDRRHGSASDRFSYKGFGLQADFSRRSSSIILQGSTGLRKNSAMLMSVVFGMITSSLREILNTAAVLSALVKRRPLVGIKIALSSIRYTLSRDRYRGWVGAL